MSEDKRPALPELIAKNLKQIQDAFAAEGIDISRQAVDQWRERGVPPNRVNVVSKVIGLAPHEIRPDVFPPPTTTKSKS